MLTHDFTIWQYVENNNLSIDKNGNIWRNYIHQGGRKNQIIR